MRKKSHWTSWTSRWMRSWRKCWNLKDLLINTGMKWSWYKKISIHAQQEKEKRSITGIVKDDTGAPLPGATVLVKGTLTGVVTDVNGNFSLSTEDVPNITIVISFVGMKTREIVVDGNKPLEIVLLPNTEELGQVVITGYYQLSQERSAGSFSVVKGERA